MRELVIFGRLHGSKTKVLLSGPEVPQHIQRARFKEVLFQREHPEFDQIELSWLEVERTRRLAKPCQSPAAESKARNPETDPAKGETNGQSAAADAVKAETKEQAPENPAAPLNQSAAKPTLKPTPKAQKKNEK